MKKINVLIVEDNAGHAGLVKRSFNNYKEDFELFFVNSISEARNAIEEKGVDIIVSDWALPDGEGFDLFSKNNSNDFDTPVILLTSQGNEELAVRALKMGVLDYIVKNQKSFEDLPAITAKAWRDWQNIKKVKEAEQKLIESEHRYRLITENINDVVWLVDLEITHFKYISPSIEKFLGYKNDELINKSINIVFGGHSLAKIEYLRQKIRNELRISKDNVKVFKIDIELEFIHKDGSPRWGDLKGSFLFENDIPKSIHGVTRDITEKRLAEKRLRIQEAYFETLIHEAPVAITILDNSDKVIQINRKFTELFGYNSSEVKGKQINDLIVPADLKGEGFDATQLVAKGQNVGFESVRRNKNGDLLDVLILGKPVFFGEDQIAVFGIYQDISEQKKIQAQLKQLSERLVLATTSVGIGIWDYNLTNKTLVWEPEMYKLHNLKPNDYADLFEVWINSVDENDRNSIRKLFSENNIKESVIQGVYKIKNGRNPRFIKYFASFIKDENGKPVRVVGACWDNTMEVEHGELEKKVEISDRVTNIKQQFLANMSHEIRSPMTGIIGMTELILKTELTDKQKKYLETIKVSSDSLLNIVNDILDLSKIEAGKMEVRPVVFNLKKSGEKIFNLFSAVSKQKDLDFSLEYDERLPDMIYADDHRIEQIITNLVSNAIKFTNQGFVKIKYNLLNILENEIDIGIDVIDSGIGISKENQLKLFDMFSQVDTSDTRTFEGAGLGLSISQRLAELLGGSIGIESELKKGTRFWFRFYARKLSRDEISEAKEQIESEKVPKLGCSVLLVEDKKTNQMVITLMLEEANCKVDVASNGEEALQKFEPGVYDFILMDIQMPIMDGLTTVKTLKKDFAPEELPPVIALSAKAMEGDAEYYISQGMDDYLTKPISANRLYQKISALAQKNRKN
ncbi:MAG: response regulator [Bacteroidales bacterium]